MKENKRVASVKSKEGSYINLSIRKPKRFTKRFGSSINSCMERSYAPSFTTVINNIEHKYKRKQIKQCLNKQLTKIKLQISQDRRENKKIFFKKTTFSQRRKKYVCTGIIQTGSKANLVTFFCSFILYPYLLIKKIRKEEKKERKDLQKNSRK